MGIANRERVVFVRRALGAFPFGGDVFVSTAAGIALAWGSNMAVAQFCLSSFWSAVSGIGCFVLTYGIASWTYMLSESEKSGIHGAVSGTARMLGSRA